MKLWVFTFLIFLSLPVFGRDERLERAAIHLRHAHTDQIATRLHHALLARHSSVPLYLLMNRALPEAGAQGADVFSGNGGVAMSEVTDDLVEVPLEMILNELKLRMIERVPPYANPMAREEARRLPFFNAFISTVIFNQFPYVQGVDSKTKEMVLSADFISFTALRSQDGFRGELGSFILQGRTDPYFRYAIVEKLIELTTAEIKGKTGIVKAHILRWVDSVVRQFIHLEVERLQEMDAAGSLRNQHFKLLITAQKNNFSVNKICGIQLVDDSED